MTTPERDPDPTQDPPRLRLRTVEVAVALDVSPDTVRRLVADGDLPALRIGGALQFRHEDVAAYLDAARTAPAVGVKGGAR